MSPVLCMLTANSKFRLESDIDKTDAGATLFQLQQGQWAPTGYMSMKLLKGFKIVDL